MDPLEFEVHNAAVRVQHMFAAQQLFALLKSMSATLPKTAVERLNAAIESKAGLELVLRISEGDRCTCLLTAPNDTGGRDVMRVIHTKPGGAA